MNLGMVKRLYQETSGGFTMYLCKKDKPGLSLLPREDEALFNSQQLVDDKRVCNMCGQVYESTDVPAQCDNCHSKDFVQPVYGNKLQ
jgi:rubrerythrin